MKKYIVFFVLIILAVAVSACAIDPSSINEPQVLTTFSDETRQVGNENSNSNENANNSTTKNSNQMPVISAVPGGPLTEEEISGLIFMREEEKLAGKSKKQKLD